MQASVGDEFVSVDAYPSIEADPETSFGMRLLQQHPIYPEIVIGHPLDRETFLEAPAHLAPVEQHHVRQCEDGIIERPDHPARDAVVDHLARRTAVVGE